MSKPVICGTNIPIHPPLSLLICIGLLLDRFKVSGLVWGIVGTISASLYLLLFLARIGQGKHIKPLEDIIDERIAERLKRL